MTGDARRIGEREIVLENAVSGGWGVKGKGSHIRKFRGAIGVSILRLFLRVSLWMMERGMILGERSLRCSL